MSVVIYLYFSHICNLVGHQNGFNSYSFTDCVTLVRVACLLVLE